MALIAKRGYAVRLPSGELRGVYRDRATARMIAALADLNECFWHDRRAPTIERCELRPWQRYGLHARPIGS